MVKVKYLFEEVYYEKVDGKTDYDKRRVVNIDDVINKFLDSKQITKHQLIDIKISPIGHYANGEGGMESSALVIYED